jgi:hypothetical protein
MDSSYLVILAILEEEVPPYIIMAGFNTYYEAFIQEAALAYYLDPLVAFVKEDYHSLAFCSSCSYDVVIAFNEHLRVD